MSDPAANVELEAATPRRLSLDLATSYLLSLTRVVAMATVMAVLYRQAAPVYVAVFVTVRSLLSVFTYAFAGVAPVTLRALHSLDDERLAPVASVVDDDLDPQNVLRYQRGQGMTAVAGGVDAVVAHHQAAARLLFAVGLIAIAGLQLSNPLAVPGGGTWLVKAIGYFGSMFALGALLRVGSDFWGALSQRAHHLWLDNTVQIGGDALFLLLVVRTYFVASPDHALTNIGGLYLVTGLGIALTRAAIAKRLSPLVLGQQPLHLRTVVAVLAAMLTVTAGSMADFLYAPANVLIIHRFLDQVTLAAYGPALEIDAALLLAVSAISTVLLPRVSEAMMGRGSSSIRRMYLVSSLTATALLSCLALVVVLMRRPLLELWLSVPLPLTMDILPLVLIHTVIGGTAGIGRAVLLGMGRFKAYTLSALVGGIANVALALLFVVGFGWGLRGIVFATIIAVTLRCALWMPWYILRTLRSSDTPTRLTR